MTNIEAGTPVFIWNPLANGRRPERMVKPRQIFFSPDIDLFDYRIAFSEIFAIMLMMQHAPKHRFYVSTAYPERMLAFFDWWGTTAKDEFAEVMPYVWLGVKASSQEDLERRLPLLNRTPAKNRWVHLRAMTGPVSLARVARQEEDWDFYDDYLRGVHPHQCGAAHGRGLQCVAVAQSADSGAEDWVYRVREECSEAGVPFWLSLDGRAWHAYP